LVAIFHFPFLTPRTAAQMPSLRLIAEKSGIYRRLSAYAAALCEALPRILSAFCGR
jgi:hypothetical protein